MKNFHYISAKIFEYCIIIICFALPPLFTHPVQNQAGSVQAPAGGTIPAVSIGFVLFYAVCTVFLYLRAAAIYRPQNTYRKTSEPLCIRAKHIAAALYKICICFCALAASALFWNYIAKAAGVLPLPPVILPQHPIKRYIFFASTIVLACYEEMLFRFFLPEEGKALIVKPETSASGGGHKGKNAHKSRTVHTATAAAELIPIILFALAHRYLGIYAVCNALCAAVILRVALHKKVHIFALCFIHCAYNISVFIAMSRIY